MVNQAANLSAHFISARFKVGVALLEVVNVMKHQFMNHNHEYFYFSYSLKHTETKVMTCWLIQSI